MRKHNHYYRPFPWASIDVYRLLAVYEVTCPIRQHVIKKLLVAGNRGAKDLDRDIQDAIDSLVRLQEMRAEDAALSVDTGALVALRDEWDRADRAAGALVGSTPALAIVDELGLPNQHIADTEPMRALVDRMDAADARDAADTLRGAEAIAEFLESRPLPPTRHDDPNFITGTGVPFDRPGLLIPVESTPGADTGSEIVLHRVGVAPNGEVDPAIVTVTLTDGGRVVSIPGEDPPADQAGEMIALVGHYGAEVEPKPASLYLPFERLPAAPGIYVRLVPLDDKRFREYFAHWDGVAWGIGRAEKFAARPRTPGAGSSIVCRWRFLMAGE